MKGATSSGSPSGTRAPARVGVPAAARGIGSHVSAGLVAETVGPADDAFEREADRIAEAVVRGGPLRAGWSAAASSDDTIQRTCVVGTEKEQIRRAPKNGEAMADVAPAAPTPVVAGPATATAPEAAMPAVSQPEAPATEQLPALLVEDEGEPTRGQMRKSEFMATLRANVCGAVDAGLSGSGRDSQGCPWIDHWLGYYEGRSSSQIERSLRRYAPETGAAASARDYIQAVTARVQRSAEIWAKTGEMTGVPFDVPPSPMPGGNAAGAFGGMFFTARPGGAHGANPVSVRNQLGPGDMLPGGLRSRMESVFGANFTGVRLHTDATGGQISNQLNARAFAVGQHVAFAPGEFRPGTVAGDALIAHELAHVVQQGSTRTAPSPVNAGRSQQQALEDDADHTAARAVSSLWGATRQIGRNAVPRMTSGLRLQRCETSSSGPVAPGRLMEARKNFRSENKGLGAAKLDKIDKALDIATKDNLDLQIRYYDYYSNHELVEDLPATSKELATTKPGSDTRLRVDVLTPGFSNSTLGSTLIHELVHTRHEQNVMGLADFQEGEAYGIEYVLAAHSGDKDRMKAIENIMGNPGSIAIPKLIPALIDEFKTAFATMTVLYEVIDTGSSTRKIPALTTPSALTADEARAMVTQLIASKTRDQRLADLLKWIKANLSSFTFPI